MVALIVVAILAFVAVPSIQPLLSRNRLTTETNGLLATLSHARSEAIMRAQNILMCTSADGASCDGTADWTHQIITFVDTDSSGSPAPAEILRIAGGAPGKMTITPTNIPHPLFFTARGFAAQNAAGALLPGGAKLSVGMTDYAPCREVWISAGGQVRSANPGGAC